MVEDDATRLRNFKRAISIAHIIAGGRSAGFVHSNEHLVLLCSHKGSRSCRIIALACHRDERNAPVITNDFDGQPITLIGAKKHWHAKFYEGLAVFRRIPLGEHLSFSSEEHNEQIC